MKTKNSNAKPHISTSKSPIQLARSVYEAAQLALEDYSSRFSKHDFTQPQLFSILVLRIFFKTDYRGIIVILEDFSDLRATLNLKKIPHHTTLVHAEKRLLKKRSSMPCKELFSSWLGSSGSLAGKDLSVRV